MVAFKIQKYTLAIALKWLGDLDELPPSLGLDYGGLVAGISFFILD